MEISEYQNGTEQTAIYRDNILRTGYKDYDKWQAIAYCALKLNGEAGEVAEHIGKMQRDDAYAITDERREAVFKELGDVGWYLSQLCTEFGFQLDDVLSFNLIKLQDRKQRSMLQGSGSDR